MPVRETHAPAREPGRRAAPKVGPRADATGDSKIALSVVLPVYNAERTVAAQLEALLAQHWDYTWELVVVDNRSTDRSREIIERYRLRMPRLRIVDARARYGAAYAANTGAATARSRALAFCDADDVVGTDWVATIGRALERYDFVASRHELRRLNPAWLQRTRGTGQSTGLPRLWYPPYCPHAGCCGLGIRRSLFDESGGFDDDLMYLQDTDLCVRLYLRGIELHYIPDAVVHVRYRSGLRGLFRQSRLWSEHNVLLYRRYREYGAPIPDAWRTYRRACARLIRQMMKVRSRSDVVRLAWSMGTLSGLLRGSLRYRIEPAIPPRRTGSTATARAAARTDAAASDVRSSDRADAVR